MKNELEPDKIGDTFYLRFYFQKRQFKLSLRTPSKRIAEMISGQVHKGLEFGVFDSFEEGTAGKKLFDLLVSRPGMSYKEAMRETQSKSGRKNLNEALAEYLENCKTEHAPRNYTNEVRTFKSFEEHCNKSTFVHDVTQEMIERWRNKRLEDVSKSTTNREIKMIKRFFNQAVDKNYLEKSPAEKIKLLKEAEHDIRHLSEEEVRKVLSAAPEDLHKILLIYLLTGMRYAELCYLQWSDIDLRRKQIIIQAKEGWTPKSTKKRIIPMHSKVEEILKSLERRESTDFVFPDERGQCAEKSLRNRLYRIFENAKVRGNVKDLRSTYASNLVMSGIPIYSVSKLLGHHDVKITEKHYAHLAPNYLQNIMTDYKPKFLSAHHEKRNTKQLT